VGRKNDLCCLGYLLFEIHGGSKIFSGCDELAYSSGRRERDKSEGALPQMKQLSAIE